MIATTHFLDASLVYGATGQTAGNLRSFRAGRMRAQITRDGRMFMPNVNTPTQSCNVATNSEVCYRSGKRRPLFRGSVRTGSFFVRSSRNRLQVVFFFFGEGPLCVRANIANGTSNGFSSPIRSLNGRAPFRHVPLPALFSADPLSAEKRRLGEYAIPRPANY